MYVYEYIHAHLSRTQTFFLVGVFYDVKYYDVLLSEVPKIALADIYNTYSPSWRYRKCEGPNIADNTLEKDIEKS